MDKQRLKKGTRRDAKKMKEFTRKIVEYNVSKEKNVFGKQSENLDILKYSTS